MAGPREQLTPEAQGSQAGVGQLDVHQCRHLLPQLHHHTLLMAAKHDGLQVPPFQRNQSHG